MAKRRIILLFLAAAVSLTLFAGCGTTGTETSAPETSEKPTPAVSTEETQTPEILTGIPVDLLSEELNVFCDISFPEGYTVYAAGFENNVSFSFYDLYLTAEGNTEEIITYMSNLLGDGAEESIRQNIDAFNMDGGVSIHGTEVEDGLNADCEISATEEDTYDYDYVEGCTIRLRADINDTSDYDKIIEENFNLNSLSDVAEFFDIMPINVRSEIYVRKLRNNAQINVVYDNVEDVAGLMENMRASMAYEGFDESINVMNLQNYGEIGNSIFFDPNNNSISIFQGLGDSGKNYKDYKIATTALDEMGFTNYIESDAMCEYKDEANDLMISINIPAWGSRPDEWENSCILFVKEINGYLLAIWYYPAEGVYRIQADKDDASAKYEYYANTDVFDGEQPDPDTATEYFADVYGLVEAENIREDVYMVGIAMFRSYINDTFGMGAEELYNLAASE
ncbi:MAG: hypothetical protein EOM54_08050 [Clostridia bacterium]|nr:hypothetical protein [Clostridia bacterium]